MNVLLRLEFFMYLSLLDTQNNIIENMSYKICKLTIGGVIAHSDLFQGTTTGTSGIYGFFKNHLYGPYSQYWLEVPISGYVWPKPSTEGRPEPSSGTFRVV